MPMLCKRSLRRCLRNLVVASFTVGMIIGIGFVADVTIPNPFARNAVKRVPPNEDAPPAREEVIDVQKTKPEHSLSVGGIPMTVVSTGSTTPMLNYDVHLFYYPWYGNLDVDGKYLHWNHRYIKHWNPAIATQWPTGSHIPPDDIGSNFYPLLGPYSSKDPKVVDKHMQQIRKSGAGKCF